MKLLLTSGGITNTSMEQALIVLMGKPISEAKVCFVVTASLAEPDDKGWLVDDLTRTHALGWKQFDVLSLSGLPRAMVLARLAEADVIYGNGGNDYYLSSVTHDEGLAEPLLDLLQSRVYVGSSAGAMIFSKNLNALTAVVFGDEANLIGDNTETMKSPFGLFDWYIKPHLNSSEFPGRDLGWAAETAAKVDFPVYFLDDQSALKIVDGAVEVVSEGQWKLFKA